MRTAIVSVSAHSSDLRTSSVDGIPHYFLSIASPSEWPAMEQHRNKGAEAGQPRHLPWNKEQTASLCSPGLCAKNDKNICVGLLKKKSFWYTENALLLGILRKMFFASK